MSRASGPTLTRKERGTAVATLCGTALIAVSIVVFVGWEANLPALRGRLLGPSVVLPNTAASFLLGGITLLLRRSDAHRSRWALRIAALAASAVLALGVAVLAERTFGVDLGVDLVLFPNAVLDFARSTQQPNPGRYALNSSVCFVLAGGALLLLDRELPSGRRPAQWLAFGGLAIATVALFGYLFGARPLYAIDRVTGMALYTAVIFVLLFVGILASRADRGGVALLTGTDLGAVLARRLLPTVVLVPTLLGWLFIRARAELLVTREGAVSLLVVATIATLGFVVLRAAREVRAAERDRAGALAREGAARRAAEAASRAKSDFLAVMSHELRTPLNAIIGYEALLSDGITGPVTDAQRQQLSRIRAGATHLVGLIDEILTLSRIEAGRERVHAEAVDVATAIDEAAAMTAPQAAAKGLRFVARAPEPSIVVRTDPAKLRQVMLNLLSNAVKFTERGEVELSAAVDGGVVVFRVRDTGIGISAEDLARIFDPFWQVEHPTTRRVTGTGLGLDVSRRLALLLGGELSVTSVVGEGSEFVLRLPLAVPARGGAGAHG